MQFPSSIKLTSRDRRHIIFKTDKREKDGSGEINMTLYEAQKNQEYTIAGLFVEETVTRRLQALGLNDGTKVRVLNKKKRGALIIQVRGTRLALGKHLSSNIEIRKEQG